MIDVIVAADKAIGFAVAAVVDVKRRGTIERFASSLIFVLRFLFNNAVTFYFLTKYSAIFAEVKGYFGITTIDNQLGQRSLCSLKSNNQLECLESG